MYGSQMDFLSSLRNAAPDVSLSDALTLADQTGLPKWKNAATDRDNLFYAHLLGKGKKITAIKEYRHASGANLRDAKDYIDKMEADLLRDVAEYNIGNPGYPAL